MRTYIAEGGEGLHKAGLKLHPIDEDAPTKKPLQVHNLLLRVPMEVVSCAKYFMFSLYSVLDHNCGDDLSNDSK